MKYEIDYEKMTVAEQMRQGLKESIAQARGELTLKTTTLAAPAPRLSKSRVTSIRKKARMSQGLFASYLNVPKSTLQSWEQGLRVPKAGEARLLQMFEAAPEQVLKLVSTAAGDGIPKRRSPSKHRKAV